MKADAATRSAARSGHPSTATENDPDQEYRFVCCLCHPQRVNGRPTGPSVAHMAPTAGQAAFKHLAYVDWGLGPGYQEVVVYMDPAAQHQFAGRRWRVRVHLELER